MIEIDLGKVTNAKYIKLGQKGAWEDLCFKDGTIRLGYYEIPHDFGFEKSKDIIFKSIRGMYGSDIAATNHARQVMDFYLAGPETLWITFSKGQMWWSVTHQKVEYMGHDKVQYPDGSRLKRTVSGWHNCSINGLQLRMNELSGKLTRSAAYRQTICEIKGDTFEYLMNKIKGEDVPQIAEAKVAQESLLRSAEVLIKMLTPQDFELFVDLLFSSSGWRRVSVLGGTTKGTDIELFMPLTNERVAVQIKSDTNQAELDEYQGQSADRMFYAYHSSKGELISKTDDIIVMGPAVLAASALRSGLVDWLIGKVG